MTINIIEHLNHPPLEQCDWYETHTEFNIPIQCKLKAEWIHNRKHLFCTEHSFAMLREEKEWYINAIEGIATLNQRLGKHMAKDEKRLINWAKLAREGHAHELSLIRNFVDNYYNLWGFRHPYPGYQPDSGRE